MINAVIINLINLKKLKPTKRPHDFTFTIRSKDPMIMNAIILIHYNNESHYLNRFLVEELIRSDAYGYGSDSLK
jgi:hypothetical protein